MPATHHAKLLDSAYLHTVVPKCKYRRIDFVNKGDDIITKYEIMDSIIEQNDGYLMTAVVQEAGISRTYLSKHVKDREMEQVEPGIYIHPEIWPDPFFILQLKNKGVIFSNETALYLHGLMEHEPTRMFVSVKRGYNATHLIKRGIKPYFVKKENFNEGVTVVKTPFGNDVCVYDIDRTICDMVLRKNEMDIQVFQTALKEYMSSQRKNKTQFQKVLIFIDFLQVYQV